MTSATLPSSTGIVSAYTYDDADRLTNIAHVKGGSTTLASVAYTLDDVGNRTQRVDQQGTHTYAYDDLYRLTSVTYPGPSTTSYAFDAFGNRTSMTTSSGTTAYTYDDADRITQVQPPSPASAIAYDWDDNGNLVERGSDTFAWDYEDRMVEATVNSVTSTYAYRGDGLRDSRAVGMTTTTFTWDINAGLPVVLDDGNQYVYGAGLSAMKQSGDWFYYLADGLGSTMAIVDANGDVEKGYTYDVYGEPTVTGSLANEFDFAGQQTDPTGLQYLRARYYDPETGTFLSREPLERLPGWMGNPFGYAGSNAVSRTDPTGLCPFGLPKWVCGDMHVYGDETAADVANDVVNLGNQVADVVDPWLQSYIDANVIVPIAPGAVVSVGCQVEILDPLDPHCYTGIGVGTPGLSVTVGPEQSIVDGTFCEFNAGAGGTAGQVGIGNLLDEKGGSTAPFGTVGFGTPGVSYTCGVIDPGLPDLWP
ncbi:MAG: RHS repeat-associated core domain-containing protein [Chloroflexi bacterium]|nr:RHS repeat-associated core domain-containing protein [Chloroflexota bacterium]